MSTGSDEENVNRRRFLQGLAVASASGIAGCSANEDGDDGGSGSSGDGGDTGGSSSNGGNQNGGQTELGERVPEVVLEFWAGQGTFTTFWERAGPIVQESIQELGVNVDLVSTDYGSAAGALITDQREMNITAGGLSSLSPRLDPHVFSQWMTIDWAGSIPQPNVLNYASCEFTVPATLQASAASLEERQEYVNQSQSVMSDDAVLVPITPSDVVGAYRTDKVEPGNIGDGGVTLTNPWAYIYSTPTDGNQLVVSGSETMVESPNHLPSLDAYATVFYSNTVYSSLFEYDHNFELQNVLANGYEVSDDGTQITVELRDATFHDSSQLTADDVAFTFKYLWTGGRDGTLPRPRDPPYVIENDEPVIEAIDEQTVEFNFETPWLPFITLEAPQWGILPKAVWEEQGAWDNIGEFVPDPVVGSGPFELSDFNRQENMLLTPSDQDHPIHNPEHEIFFQAFRGIEAAGESLKAGELHFAHEIPIGTAEDLLDNYAEVAELAFRRSFLPFALYNQHPHPPTKFKPFRRAIATVVDRQLANEVAFRGRSTEWMDTGMFGETHPWRPPDEHLWFPTDDPSGDVDGARSILEEAGWGWDDNGNLHYPADADLTPRWPAGERPDPAEFECLDEEYELILE